MGSESGYSGVPRWTRLATQWKVCWLSVHRKLGHMAYISFILSRVGQSGYRNVSWLDADGKVPCRGWMKVSHAVTNHRWVKGLQ